MGLFSNNKKPCPICGKATPRLLATKIEDMPICSDCDIRISMDQDMLKDLTLDGLRQHFAFLDNNEAEKQFFHPNKSYRFIYSGKQIEFDDTTNVFVMSVEAKGMLFHCSEVTSFAVFEDNHLLLAGSQQGLQHNKLNTRQHIADLAPQIQMRMLTEQITDMQDKRPDPSFRVPMDGWRIEIVLQHPYYKKLEHTLPNPTWDSYNPDCARFLRAYDEMNLQLEDFANTMMRMCFPNAARTAQAAARPAAAPRAAAAAPASGKSAAQELKELKELVDMGIVTPEEFAAKKKQLLGL